MFKKRQAKAGGARKQTPRIQATSNTRPLPSSPSAPTGRGRPFEVKKRKLQTKKEKEGGPGAHRTTLVLGLQRGGPRGARGARRPAAELEESTRAAEEPPGGREEPAEDTAARARKARVAGVRAPRPRSQPPAVGRMGSAKSPTTASDDGLGGRASAQDFVPVPAGPIMELRRGSRTRNGGAGCWCRRGDVDAPAAPGGAMDAALRRRAGYEDDAS